MSINPIHFDLDQSAAADRRRAAPSERSTHRDRRPGHPYPRESAPGSTISRTNSESQISDYITSGLLVYDDLDSIQGGSEGRKKGKQREVPKVEYPPTERAAVDWMRSKLEIDMITVKGWLSMSTDEEKFAVEVYLREVVAQANQKYHCNVILTDVLSASLLQSLSSCRGRLVDSFEPYAALYDIKPPEDSQLSASARQEYMKERRKVLFDSSKAGLFTNFLHGHEITGDTVDLLMFSNENLIEGHIQKWYRDAKSPLCDETFSRSLTTTPVTLLAWSAVALRASIDKIVNSRATRFSKNKYASWYFDIVKDMERTSAHPVHGKLFKSRLFKLHVRGMEAATKFLQDNQTAGVVYIPSLPSELSQPLDLFRSKLNYPISQSSTAPAPLPVRSAGAESYSEIPSQFSQIHTFAGGSESLLMPPFADSDNSLTGPSYYSQPGASSQYLGHEMRFDLAESTHQHGMRQENYNPPLPVPSQSQEGDNRSYHLQY